MTTKFRKKVANAIWFSLIEMSFTAMAILSGLYLATGEASSYWFGEVRCWIVFVVSVIFSVALAPGIGDYILDVVCGEDK